MQQAAGEAAKLAGGAALQAGDAADSAGGAAGHAAGAAEHAAGHAAEHVVRRRLHDWQLGDVRLHGRAFPRNMVARNQKRQSSWHPSQHAQLLSCKHEP